MNLSLNLCSTNGQVKLYIEITGDNCLLVWDKSMAWFQVHKKKRVWQYQVPTNNFPLKYLEIYYDTPYLTVMKGPWPLDIGRLFCGYGIGVLSYVVCIP